MFATVLAEELFSVDRAGVPPARMVSSTPGFQRATARSVYEEECLTASFQRKILGSASVRGRVRVLFKRVFS